MQLSVHFCRKRKKNQDLQQIFCFKNLSCKKEIVESLFYQEKIKLENCLHSFMLGKIFFTCRERFGDFGTNIHPYVQPQISSNQKMLLTKVVKLTVSHT